MTMPKTHSPVRSMFCHFCGEWPATLYGDIENKTTSFRLCEPCVETGRVIKDANGLYITNPELPAAAAGSPESGTHSS